MNQRQLIGLLAVLVVLVGLAFASGVFDREISTIDVPTLSIPAGELDALSIAAPTTTVRLEEQDSGWVLVEPVSAAADSVVVNSLIQSLTDLSLASVVSSSPGRYAHYGVDSTARTLTATWEGGERRLVVSEEGPDFESVYVRLGDDPRVFSTRGRLQLPAVDNLDRWRDKTAFTLPPSTIQSVDVQGPETAYSVARTGERWQVTHNEETVPGDSVQVSRWLDRFASLASDGFLPDLTADSVRTVATHQLHFTLTDGSDRTLWLREMDGEVALLPGPGDEVHKLFTNRLATYVPDPSTLKDE